MVADPGLLRTLRWVLTAGAVTIGTAALLASGASASLPVVGAYAVAMLLVLVVSGHRADVRPWLALDGVVALLAVVATGGVESPLLLGLLGPMLLAGIVRSVGVPAFLLLATVPLLSLTTPNVRPAVAVLGVLATATLVGGCAEALVGGPGDPVLDAAAAERERVRRLSQLLVTLESSLADAQLGTTPRGRLSAVRRWLALVDEPDVVALRRGDGPDAPWQVLGADDEVRATGATSLPSALVAAGSFRPLTLLPELTGGSGVDPTSRRAAYLWLTRGDGPQEVLALEWSRPRPFAPEEERFLDELRTMVDLHRVTGDQLQRLHERGERTERSAVAASLHDQLAQDLAYATMEVERAARRHPDDAALERLTPVLRGAVTAVRSTITDLRAPVDLRAPDAAP